MTAKQRAALADALNGRTRVRRDEPHWYAILIDRGCVLCCAGDGDTRVRVRGNAPKNPADRYIDEGSDYACSGHFA